MVITLCEPGTSWKTVPMSYTIVSSPNNFLPLSPMPLIPFTFPLSMPNSPTVLLSKSTAHSPTSSAPTRSRVPLVASTHKPLPTPLSCHQTHHLQNLPKPHLQKISLNLLQYFSIHHPQIFLINLR